MARIEDGRIRKPGERVDMLHPDFSIQKMEDGRNEYTEIRERFVDVMGKLTEDLRGTPQENTVVALGELFNLLQNLNKRLADPEIDYANKSRGKALAAEWAMNRQTRHTPIDKPGPRVR